MTRVFQKPGNKAHEVYEILGEDTPGSVTVSSPCGVVEMEDEVIFYEEEDISRNHLCFDCFPVHSWQGRNKWSE